MYRLVQTRMLSHWKQDMLWRAHDLVGMMMKDDVTKERMCACVIREVVVEVRVLWMTVQGKSSAELY